MDIKPLQPVPIVTPARKVKRDDGRDKQRETDGEGAEKSNDGDIDNVRKRVDTYA